MTKCDKGLSFEDCELAILRQAIDKIEAKVGETMISNPRITRIIDIVEDFLRKKKLICYGGTAINNILPLQDQFYNRDTELPDYDFFSTTPMEDAIELANMYHREKFEEVEAKAGVHYGTFKVFVEFIPVADITLLPAELDRNLRKSAIKVDGILYTPPNYLRMSMYLELSRPKGDVSRWEKVLKRLTLLNKNYPMEDQLCQDITIQRLFTAKDIDEEEQEKIFTVTRDALIGQGVVFFGALANRLYMKYTRKYCRKSMSDIPDFDVLSRMPERTARVVKEQLQYHKIKHVKIVKRAGIGEVIAPHYEIKIGEETIVFVYEPLACHSYNTIKMDGKEVNIATIDTMLSFYLAFVYVDRAYYDPRRILCMSEILFKVQEQNRLKQRGVLKRFTMECYGKQQTLEDSRFEKTTKFKELKGERGTKEYEMYFLRYNPAGKRLKKRSSKKSGKKTTKKHAKGKKKKVRRRQTHRRRKI